MAAKKKTAKKPPAEAQVTVTVPSGTFDGLTDPRGSDGVRAIEVPKARRLVTIPPDHPVWEPGDITITFPKIQAGDIVRIRPPASAPDEVIAGMRELCALRGAERVFVLPKPKSEVIPDRKKAAKVTAVGARAAVMGLVVESNSADREALAKLCDRVMSEENL